MSQKRVRYITNRYREYIDECVFPYTHPPGSSAQPLKEDPLLEVVSFLNENQNTFYAVELTSFVESYPLARLALTSECEVVKLVDTHSKDDNKKLKQDSLEGEWKEHILSENDKVVQIGTFQVIDKKIDNILNIMMIWMHNYVSEIPLLVFKI